MNHFSALFVALLIGATSFAQLPDGSIAPDLLILLGEFGTDCE